MTSDEYALWVEQPNALRIIVDAHLRGESVSRLVEDPSRFALAARVPPEQVATIEKWLRQTKRLT
jgi:riboflavin biosynthesis pyrimidine reductase